MMSQGAMMTTFSNRLLNPVFPFISALLFFALYGGGPAHAAVSFQSFAIYSTGGNPRRIVTADLNADAKTDLVVANQSSDNITVLLGNGDGSFPTVTSYATGNTPRDLVIGDFNGDGAPDLAVANSGANYFSVRLGSGSGTFGSSLDTVLGQPSPIGLFAGDFITGGATDIAVLENGGGHTFEIYGGNGNGTFTYALPSPSSFQPYAGIMADFNGDGKPDLAVVNYTGNSVTVYLGDGTGNFTQLGPYPTGTHPVAVISADFNRDGKLDLAVVNEGDNTVSVLLGNGDGTFQAKADYPTGILPQALIAGDFNGDSFSDLVVANYSDNTFSLLRGNGDGTFQPKTDYAAGSTPISVVSGDFNGDGKADLAIANYTSNRISIFLNSSVPAVTFTPTSYDFGNVTYNSSTRTYDFTITNTGDAQLVISAFSIGGANAAEFSVAAGGSSPCAPPPLTLLAGGSCTMSVSFTPTSGGAKAASFDVSSNVPSSPASASLAGTGVAPTYYTVTISMSGTGGGTIAVQPKPPGVDCTTNCSQQFTSGTPITLTANPDTNSVFAGWTGCQIVMGSGCSWLLASNVSATATFSYVQPLRLTGAITGDYATLQGAYNGVADGGSILGRAVTLGETLLFNRSVSIDLAGGYDTSYYGIIGSTTISGSLEIDAGTVNIASLTITP